MQKLKTSLAGDRKKNAFKRVFFALVHHASKQVAFSSQTSENSEEDKIDPPIHTGYFYGDEANTLTFIVDLEATPSVPLSCSQKFLATWSCHSTARHGVEIFAGVNAALHVALERSVVDSNGSFTNEIRLEQHFHVKETFSADSDDVSVWELVDQIDPPIQIESKQAP